MKLNRNRDQFGKAFLEIQDPAKKNPILNQKINEEDKSYTPEKQSIDESEAPSIAKDVVRTRNSREIRMDRLLSLGLNWNLIAMWLPNKIGGNIAYNYSESTTILAEYQSQGVKAEAFDFKFGEIKESKYGIMLKSFDSSNTFYLSYGLMKYQFKAGLSTDLFGVSVPFAPLFDISSMGFQFGMGNQINWDNGLTLGIEWFSIYVHMFAKSRNTEIFNYLNQSDKDKADKISNIIYNLPIIEILKVQLNYSF